jgi:hypothetical protein
MKTPYQDSPGQVLFSRLVFTFEGALSGGRARHVRWMILDNPFRLCGHDRRAPPNSPSEGPARQVRCITFDNPSRFRGHDRRALPTRRDKHAPPIWARRACPAILLVAVTPCTNLTHTAQKSLSGSCPITFPYYGDMGGGGERGAWPRGPADEGEADGDSWSGALSERP